MEFAALLYNFELNKKRMATCCNQCKADPKTPLWCKDCKGITCPGCLSTHKDHEKSLRFLCQECEQNYEDTSTAFCQDCEQHLCEPCDEKIHNKGKRAKHSREATGWETLKMRSLYVVCSDALMYYGYVSSSALLMDLIDSAAGQLFVLLIEKPKDLNQLKKYNPGHIKVFGGTNDFNEDLLSCLEVNFPLLEEIVFVESPSAKVLHETVKSKPGIKMRIFQVVEVVAKKPMQKTMQKQLGNLSISSVSLANSSFNNKSNMSNISAKYPYQQTRHHLAINISTSTENSLRKRKRKSPIAYFHPYICPKSDKRSVIEDEYRDLASDGILMVRKDQCVEFDQRVLRQFSRNIGETEVDYVSLQMDNLSIQSLFWVIRSIQEDRMAPTEKLILCRLKQSYDIKVQPKQWHYIIKYLQSNQYESDRRDADRIGKIPRLIVHPFTNQDNYILYCKPDDVSPIRWVYEDLSQLDPTDLAWSQFLTLINSYFIKNTHIGGGRYGCVQYIKFNGLSPLKDCSLGKLSMFVQEAINRGIIRYHKTLLVSNKGNEEKQKSQIGQAALTLPQLQTNIKVNTLQLLLINNFMQSGPGSPISLAQIPQNLRKSATFQINYVDLGFPKLKNLLTTLTDLVDIQLSKSHITFTPRQNTSALLEEKRVRIYNDTNLLLSLVLKNLEEILESSNMTGLAMDQLFNQLTLKTGLVLDCQLFNMPDFYRFLSIYGNNFSSIQIKMGYIIVYRKWQESAKKNQTSTPTFKQQPEIDYQFKNLENYDWEKIVMADCDSKEPAVMAQIEGDQDDGDESDSFSYYNSIEKSIYNLIDDNKTESQPQTVIEKEGSAKTANNGLFIPKMTPIDEGEDSCSNGFEDEISELVDPRGKSKGQHNRMYSNNAQQKTQHYRVYSNMSRH